MSASHPDAVDLLEVLRDHLAREVSPLLPPEQQFRLRIADRLLETLAREQAQGGAADARERAGLMRLLGEGGTGDAGREGAATEALRAELARRIREEAIPTDSPELLAHLRATLADRLRIDNPRWLPEALRGA
jgi:hypothetical protein